MAIVPMFSAHRIWLLTMVKSGLFDQSLLINRFLLFVRWQEAHKSKYHISCKACILDFFTILAIPRQKSLGSKLSLSSMAVAQFYVGCCFVDSFILGFF